MDKSTRNSFLIGLTSVVVPVAVLFLVHQLYYNNNDIKQADSSSLSTTVAKKDFKEKNKSENVPDKSKENRRVLILYGTCTGTAKLFAEKLCKRIDNCTKFVVEVMDLKDYNEDKLNTEDIVLFICSTWSEGGPPESAKPFFEWLKDYATDFRVSKDHLSKLQFSVFGLGGDIYDEYFAKAVRIFIVTFCIIIYFLFL
jgi:sulfite reductase alpha subunit-like flavoprotein